MVPDLFWKEKVPSSTCLFRKCVSSQLRCQLDAKCVLAAKTSFSIGADCHIYRQNLEALLLCKTHHRYAAVKVKVSSRFLPSMRDEKITIMDKLLAESSQ